MSTDTPAAPSSFATPPSRLMVIVPTSKDDSLVSTILDRFFRPAHGLCHPRVMRIRAKHLPASKTLMQQTIAQINQLIAGLKKSGQTSSVL